MTADAAILTAIYDGYDTLKPVMPQIDLEVEWIVVTDTVPDAEAARGWMIVHDPRPGVHPNRAAKHPKYHPWRYTDAPASVWVDASFRVLSETFAADVLAHARPIAQFAHPWRDCLHDEAQASAYLPKYAGEPVLAQAVHYAEQGHPTHWGLWATGIIARRHTTPVREMGHLWAAETDRWSFQDQISQPHALRQAGLRPTPLPGTHLANPWLTYQGSERHG